MDVRKETEFEEAHIAGAQNFPLDYINDHLTEIDKNATQYVHCAAGYRSMAFASILKARGFENVVNIRGGFKSIKESNQFDIITGIDKKD
ncbi:rhodanese-like domain-containing protein [Niabella ginsengisoli]|uniref:rhodanese-like domain-containing protein n=1 Tax=Niabella ginsengisoli TaxID=522298 RepID=UPI00293ECF98|nr:rhodanese-like domain-containing protein [Niabella ginsengisoli]